MNHDKVLSQLYEDAKNTIKELIALRQTTKKRLMELLNEEDESLRLKDLIEVMKVLQKEQELALRIFTRFAPASEPENPPDIPEEMLVSETLKTLILDLITALQKVRKNLHSLDPASTEYWKAQTNYLAIAERLEKLLAQYQEVVGTSTGLDINELLDLFPQFRDVSEIAEKKAEEFARQSGVEEG